MKRVYIAGKLNGMACDYIKNMHVMLQWAENVKSFGFAVFVPALDFLMGLSFGNYEYEDYFVNSQAWLEVSDYVFVCPGWHSSKGVNKEIIYANSLGIPVFYDIDKLIQDRDNYKVYNDNGVNNI